MNGPDSSSSNAYVFTFPFWLYCLRRNGPTVVERKGSNGLVRFYPPFRVGPANFIPMPHLVGAKIPFLIQAQNKVRGLKIPPMAFLPVLGVDEHGNTSMKTTIAAEFKPVPDPFPNDALRVDLLGQQDGERPPKELIESLLDQLRYRTNQWWIGRSADVLVGYLRSSFPIDRFGAPLDSPWGHSSGSTVTGDEVPIDRVIWKESIEAVVNGEKPPFDHLLVLDARYFTRGGDVQQAVLAAAMACELALERNAQRRWDASSRDTAFKFNRSFPGDDLRTHLDRSLRKFCGRSFAEIEPEKFRVVEKLWLARGSVAHGGAAAFYWEGNQVEVSREIAGAFTANAQACIEWLDKHVGNT